MLLIAGHIPGSAFCKLPVTSSPASQLHGFIKFLLIHGHGHVFGLREGHGTVRTPGQGSAWLDCCPTGRLPVSGPAARPYAPCTPPFLCPPNTFTGSLAFLTLLSNEQQKEMIQGLMY